MLQHTGRIVVFCSKIFSDYKQWRGTFLPDPAAVLYRMLLISAVLEGRRGSCCLSTSSALPDAVRRQIVVLSAVVPSVAVSIKIVEALSTVIRHRSIGSFQARYGDLHRSYPVPAYRCISSDFAVEMIVRLDRFTMLIIRTHGTCIVSLDDTAVTAILLAAYHSAIVSKSSFRSGSKGCPSDNRSSEEESPSELSMCCA